MQNQNPNRQRQSNQPLTWTSDTSSPTWQQAPGTSLPPHHYPDPTPSPVWHPKEFYNLPLPTSPCIVSPSWYVPPSNLSSLPYSSTALVSLYSSPTVQFDTLMYRSYPNGMNQPPRSFEELHNERSYLQYRLQAENSKHADFTRQISFLESLILQPDRTDRRKTKKQIGWLRHRLRETARQERAILGSLEQLNYEIQCRESLSKIESERRYHVLAAKQQSEILSQMGINLNFGQISLNPTSPVFKPQSSSLAMQSHMPWPLPMAYSPYPSTPMYWPQQANDYFGYQWSSSPLETEPVTSYEQPSCSYSLLKMPVNIGSRGFASPRVSPKTLTGQMPERPVSSSQRSASLNNTEEELNHMSTNSPYKILPTPPAGKRFSLPSLPGYARFWELGHEKAEDAMKSRDRIGGEDEIEELQKGKGKEMESMSVKEGVAV